MYKYGIVYYTILEGERVPNSGLEVRLLRPGEYWEDGRSLMEIDHTGYYEYVISDPEETGYFEVWDNAAGSPAFSGRTCIMGQIDARGLQNNSIYENHIHDGAVGGSKIQNKCITSSHLQDGLISIAKIFHIEHNENDGVGDISDESPASPDKDETIIHQFLIDTKEKPIVNFNNMCNHLIILKDILVLSDEVLVLLTVKDKAGIEPFKYILTIFPR